MSKNSFVLPNENDVYENSTNDHEYVSTDIRGPVIRNTPSVKKQGLPVVPNNHTEISNNFFKTSSKSKSVNQHTK